MTAEVAVETVVRWDSTTMQLVGPDGIMTGTEAQEAKVRAYLDGNHIQEKATRTETIGATLRTRTTTTYELSPIKGCKRSNKVDVATTYDLFGAIAAVTYKCGCQRAAGTVAQRPTLCSHAMAVHQFLRRNHAQG